MRPPDADPLLTLLATNAYGAAKPETLSQMGESNVNLGNISLIFFFLSGVFSALFILFYPEENMTFFVIFMDHLKYNGTTSNTLPDKY